MKKTLVPLFSLLFLAAGVLFVSCNMHSDEDHHDPNTATIHIESPLAGATFAVGATVPLSVHIEGVESLHGWEVFLRNKADNSQLAYFSEHDHGSSYHVEEDWVASVPAGTNVEVEVVVELDHDGNQTSQIVSFIVQ